MTVAPPVGAGYDSRSLTVRIEGRAASGETHFVAELPAEDRSHSYEAETTYAPEESLELRIAINFHPGRWTEAAAQVAGFRRLTVRLSGRRLEADIQHAFRAKKQCHLVCFENGQTSEGPCLTCPDGEYQIRICC